MPQSYPFSAVVGCEADDLDDMGLALILTVISPEIGGVLIRGEKGTAKSTAVRALAAVLPAIEVYSGDRFSVDPSAADDSPDGPFPVGTPTITRPVSLVELPVGATEDRVLGSVHLERALSAGEVAFEPGLLARAHRGVLYVDEVNLLHDHLVDVLLDAAAMGRVTVERDGVSAGHAARFVLIGTMNPEEGELRPQLLDRFGLTVEVAAPRDPKRRAEVVRRRMAFDADPAGFTGGYAATEKALETRIAAARAHLKTVRLSEAALLKIAEVCAAFEADGLRADIVTARTAVAHAAWQGRSDVTRADIRQAALLALPHRRRRNPFDAPGLDEDLLDQVLGAGEPPPDPPSPEGPGNPDDPEDPGSPEDGGDPENPGTPDEPETADTGQTPPPRPPEGQDGSAPETPSEPPRAEDSQGEEGGEDVPSHPALPGADGTATTVTAGVPYRPRLLSVRGLGQGAAGHRSRALAETGHRVGAQPLRGTASGSLHLVETLYAAARNPAARNPATRTPATDNPATQNPAARNPATRSVPEPPGESPRAPGTTRPVIGKDDLRVAVREGREANLVLFCVDASGSMAARKRMRQVKTAILSLLLDAYRRRDKVGLITFRGKNAEIALPPTHSVDIAAKRLEDLPAGGRTPLAEGLMEAATVILRERRRDPNLRPLLIVVTDGRATSGPDAVRRSREAADYLATLHVTTVVIDGEDGPLRLGLARGLAERLYAEHLPVTGVSAEALATTVRSRTEGPQPGATRPIAPEKTVKKTVRTPAKTTAKTTANTTGNTTASKGAA